MKQRVGPEGMGVQIDGNNNTVTLIAGRVHLVLDQRHLFTKTPTNERELLLTELRATALVGREADLATLEVWLTAEQAITCRCLIGRAGTGKTRLAIELCERAASAGWIAGFARWEELHRFSSQQNLGDWRWSDKTLIVVDYAAASASILREWLEVLARRPGCGKPLRLLLLERHADPRSGWWAELARAGGLSGLGPDALLDPAEPVALPSLRHVEERRALLVQAISEAARLRHIASPPMPPVPGVDAEFDRRLADDTINNEPLYLLMAGLVAVATGAPAALTFSRIDLALRVAAAERDRLDRLAQAAGIHPGLFNHLAACVTLQGGCDAEAAKQFVEAERQALGDRTSTWTDDLVRQLADALPLPGSGDIDGIKPDLIGEAFLWQHITGNRRKPAEQFPIIERAFARAGIAVVTVLVHAAQDIAEGCAAHETVSWLDHLASQPMDVSILIAVAEELPHHTLALREMAAKITMRIVETLRLSAKVDSGHYPRLAGWLNNLSNRLSDLDQREAARAIIQEAVELRRALAAAQPDAFGADLGNSLNNLSNRLFNLGQREAALAAIQEAVDIYRALAAAQPNAFAPDLAMLFNTFSNRLSDVGQREPALEAIQKAVRSYRVLAAERPRAFRPSLATSLSNLSNRLSDLGQREAALAAVKEAVSIRRTLASELQDAFRSDLAISLSILSNCLSNVGQREPALAAIQEAIGIYRALAQTWPDTFRADLAGALNNFSSHLADLKQDKGALAAIQEAVDIYRALVKIRRDAVRPDLAGALNNLSNRLFDFSQHEAALNAVQEAVNIYRSLAEASPDIFLPKLAVGLSNLSIRLSAVRQSELALRASQEAVDIRRALAKSWPDAFRPDLALSLWGLAYRLDTMDSLSAGLAVNAEAIAVLAVPFLQLPAAFAEQMATMVQGYRQRCRVLGRESDTKLLDPILAMLKIIPTEKRK